MHEYLFVDVLSTVIQLDYFTNRAIWNTFSKSLMSSISNWVWNSAVLGIGALASFWFYERYYCSENNHFNSSKSIPPVQEEPPDDQPILRQSLLTINLITKVRYPSESTTIVTRHSEWEKAFAELSKYKLFITTFYDFLIILNAF